MPHDSLKGRRKRGKSYAVPVTEAEVNAMQERHMRKESGAKDPGTEFMKHQRRRRRRGRP